MIAKDLRQFINILDRTGDLVRVKQEVHWDLEVGAISRRAYEIGGPAVLFEKIKDYPEGYRLFNGATGTFRRVAIAMGLPPDTTVREIYAEFERRHQNPVKPQTVKEAPCQEQVFTDDKVNVYSLPALYFVIREYRFLMPTYWVIRYFPLPLWERTKVRGIFTLTQSLPSRERSVDRIHGFLYLHEGDGGRYLGSWDIVVSRDPDTGWTNWGMYRFMVHNHHYLTGDPRAGSDLGIVLHGKYVPDNKPMPVAIVLGADPLSHMVATSSYGIGVDEVDYAGALARSPIDLVQCVTIPLLVPARAEVIIEGEILPDKIAVEGPFGEYPGYRSRKVRSGILMQVKAITLRSSPILTVICLGIPPDDASIAASLTAGWAMKRRLLRHQLPVTDVYVPPAGVTHLVVG